MQKLHDALLNFGVRTISRLMPDRLEHPEVLESHPLPIVAYAVIDETALKISSHPQQVLAEYFNLPSAHKIRENFPLLLRTLPDRSTTCSNVIVTAIAPLQNI